MSTHLTRMVGMALAALLVAGTGCATPVDIEPAREPGASTEDATAEAEATLGRFFEAWSAEDEAAAESFLAESRRGMTWEFERIDRVEFGPIRKDPDWVDDYLTNGFGTVTGVAAEDVRCFQADVTFYYPADTDGAPADGQTLAWHWFLERDASGTWQVTDWGY